MDHIWVIQSSLIRNTIFKCFNCNLCRICSVMDDKYIRFFLYDKFLGSSNVIKEPGCNEMIMKQVLE